MAKDRKGHGSEKKKSPKASWKARQIMSARQKIATFRANEGKSVPDYRTPLEKARQGIK